MYNYRRGRGEIVIGNTHLAAQSLLTDFNENDWIQAIGNMIVHPLVALILTCIIFLGFTYQLYSKKINIVGIISAFTLLVFFLGFLVRGEVSLTTMLVFAVGVILVIVEMFVVGAVLGIIGMVLITMSIVSLGDSILVMVVNVVIALILTLVEWFILVKVLKRKIPFLEKVVLRDSTSTESGYTSHDDRGYLVGKTAEAVTDLRPAGIILCDGKRIDAVSNGDFILRNKQVCIEEVEGTRVVVREIKS